MEVIQNGLDVNRIKFLIYEDHNATSMYKSYAGINHRPKVSAL